jgi:hypothetical protein
VDEGKGAEAPATEDGPKTDAESGPSEKREDKVEESSLPTGDTAGEAASVGGGDEPSALIPPGYELCHGQLTRKRTSSMPPYISSALWSTMSYSKRLKAAEDYQKQLAESKVSSGAEPPAMPVVSKSDPVHRQKDSARGLPFNVCVARPVGKREIEASPAA